MPPAAVPPVASSDAATLAPVSAASVRHEGASGVPLRHVTAVHQQVAAVRPRSADAAQRAGGVDQAFDVDRTGAQRETARLAVRQHVDGGEPMVTDQCLGHLRQAVAIGGDAQPGRTACARIRASARRSSMKTSSRKAATGAPSADRLEEKSATPATVISFSSTFLK